VIPVVAIVIVTAVTSLPVTMAGVAAVVTAMIVVVMHDPRRVRRIAVMARRYVIPRVAVITRVTVGMVRRITGTAPVVRARAVIVEV
jgi:hypothetical protein